MGHRVSCRTSAESIVLMLDHAENPLTHVARAPAKCFVGHLRSVAIRICGCVSLGRNSGVTALYQENVVQCWEAVFVDVGRYPSSGQTPTFTSIPKGMYLAFQNMIGQFPFADNYSDATR